MVVPLSVVLASTFTLGLDLVVVFAFLLFIAQVPVLTTWLLLPALIVWLYALTLGTSLLLATVYVRFRDIAQIWLVMTRLLFYASPVIFPIELFPPGWKAAPGAQPARPAVRADACLDGRPERAHLLRGDRGRDLLDLPRAHAAQRPDVGGWLFAREAPQVAEQL